MPPDGCGWDLSSRLHPQIPTVERVDGAEGYDCRPGVLSLHVESAGCLATIDLCCLVDVLSETVLERRRRQCRAADGTPVAVIPAPAGTIPHTIPLLSFSLPSTSFPSTPSFSPPSHPRHFQQFG